VLVMEGDCNKLFDWTKGWFVLDHVG
jgi:hypothetical protein